jgi:hypothetical protein
MQSPITSKYMAYMAVQMNYRARLSSFKRNFTNDAKPFSALIWSYKKEI